MKIHGHLKQLADPAACAAAVDAERPAGTPPAAP
jgi:hypothetical protein